MHIAIALCTLQVHYADCESIMHITSALCILREHYAHYKCTMHIARALCTLQVHYAYCERIARVHITSILQNPNTRIIYPLILL